MLDAALEIIADSEVLPIIHSDLEVYRPSENLLMLQRRR
jgi:hypothetical protein